MTRLPELQIRDTPDLPNLWRWARDLVQVLEERNRTELVGSIVFFPVGLQPPEGWALCDGSVVSGLDTRYRRIYAAIQNTFGGVAPSFALPTIAGPVAGVGAYIRL